MGEENNQEENNQKEKIEKEKQEANATAERIKQVNDSVERIENANAAADRIEAANKNLEQLILRQEALRTEQILGGNAAAGSNQEPTQEEKEIASARGLLKGTGYEDDLFPTEK